MTFTLVQALKAQQALRDAAQLPAEEFPVQAFIGMLSDEIEALRVIGKTDDEITEVINGAAGTKLSASDVVRHYASQAQRQRR
jgi:hypothetical protein